MKTISKNARLSLTALVFGVALMSCVESQAMDISEKKAESLNLIQERIERIGAIFNRIKNTANPCPLYINQSLFYLSECNLVAAMIEDSAILSDLDRTSANYMGRCARTLEQGIITALKKQ